MGKTKRKFHGRKMGHFKALPKNDHTSAIADHVNTTGYNIKWDHFDILVAGKLIITGKSKKHCLYKN